jgi:hypothetical protein
MSIAESDWKKFRKVRELALERLCTRILSEIQKAGTRPDLTSHERYLEIYQLIQDRDRDIARTFNDPRRSTARMQLLSMVSLELVTPEELGTFSQELQTSIAGHLEL